MIAYKTNKCYISNRPQPAKVENHFSEAQLLRNAFLQWRQSEGSNYTHAYLDGRWIYADDEIIDLLGWFWEE